ncbi:hypothetical protein LJ737_04235 [Hymenobacter sp. 15J16-1T3B]|uniref:hypothetical protein n=1 Tax=Hymenobacter sp. 15J16-1T3B TaxID=2886941 RepID=UPI001D0F6107|nr:hypothetical protein [Hymenobacter sp. 15J16-1T3B]MCC3156431.1 hypothetical protein [Hymenobacter sp. 15J16-1T3B]
MNIELVDLLKICFGTGVIITPVVALVQKVLLMRFEVSQQAKIEAVKADYQSQIEAVKSKLNQEIEQYKSINAGLSGVYLSSNHERVQSLKEAWKAHLVVRSDMPFYLTMSCNVMTRDEVVNARKTNNIKFHNTMNAYDPKVYLEKLSEAKAIIDAARPFIGLRVWMLYSASISTMIRIAFKAHSQIGSNESYYWLDDKHLLNNIISKVVDSNNLRDIISSNGFEKLSNLLDYIEVQIVEETNSQLTGKAFSLHQVQAASEVMKTTVVPTPQLAEL